MVVSFDGVHLREAPRRMTALSIVRLLANSTGTRDLDDWQIWLHGTCEESCEAVESLDRYTYTQEFD